MLLSAYEILTASLSSKFFSLIQRHPLAAGSLQFLVHGLNGSTHTFPSFPSVSSSAVNSQCFILDGLDSLLHFLAGHTLPLLALFKASLLCCTETFLLSNGFLVGGTPSRLLFAENFKVFLQHLFILLCSWNTPP